MEGGRAPACTTQVSFVCQRCSQPLKLDTSFKILDRLTIQELTAPLLTAAPARPGDAQEESALSEEAFTEGRQDGVSRRFIPPARYAARAEPAGTPRSACLGPGGRQHCGRGAVCLGFCRAFWSLPLEVLSMGSERHSGAAL